MWGCVGWGGAGCGGHDMFQEKRIRHARRNATDGPSHVVVLCDAEAWDSYKLQFARTATKQGKGKSRSDGGGKGKGRSG